MRAGGSERDRARMRSPMTAATDRRIMGSCLHGRAYVSPQGHDYLGVLVRATGAAGAGSGILLQ